MILIILIVHSADAALLESGDVPAAQRGDAVHRRPGAAGQRGAAAHALPAVRRGLLAEAGPGLQPQVARLRLRDLLQHGRRYRIYIQPRRPRTP